MSMETDQCDVFTDIRPAARPALRQWLVLVLLAVGILIAFVDRTSISSTLAVPSFNRHFRLTDVGRGWVLSAFFWSYGLVQIVMGWIVDRYGVKLPYTICFVVWSAATAATSGVNTIEALVLVRLIVGAAEAAVIPASYRWIRNNFDETRSGTTTGVLAMGNKFGPAIGAPVAAWLIVRYDWRIMFIVTGLVGFVWLVPWLLIARNDAPDRDEARRRRVAASTVPFVNIIRSPLIWGTMILNFCYGYFSFFCMTWMPSYLVQERGLSLSRSALFTFISFAGIAILAVVAGYAADRLIARGGDPVRVRKWFITAGFLGACTVLIGAFAKTLGVALFWNVTSLLLLGFATANILALCRLTLIPKQAVGLATGVQQVATSLAGGASASISGWLLHVSGGFALPMFVIFVFLLVGAATTWILLRPEYAPRISEPTLPAA